MRNWYRRPLPAAVLLVLLWTGVRMAALRQTGIPPPRVHDEFSYLLAADTFARGRLANPPHPMAKFFESPHILVRPTYGSKYPPGQGLFLALGQRVFGDPFYGVLIGNALMLFSFCLMLYAWVPPVWALAVSGMFALCLRPGMYWTDSYWGGSVAAAGGALVLLGIGMYRKRQGTGAGIVFGLGSVLLLWTRTVEGGVLTLLLLAVFGGEIWRKRRAAPFLAAAGVLAAALAWTCAHNKAVTGDPLLPPYLLHQRMYVVGQPFWFLPVGPEPEFSHPRLASHFGKRGFDVTRFSSSGTSGWRNYSNGLARTLEANGLFLGPGLLLFLVLPFGWRSADYRKLSIATMGFLFLNALVTYHFPHYQAPLWAVLAVMTAMASEQIWRSRAGRFPAGAAIVALALTSPLQADLIQRQRPRGVTAKVRVKPWPVRRAELIKELSRLERRQLVLVRYPAPDWKVNCEWVYNGADIDSQRVIFAHDLGEGENRALLSYYPDRDVVPLTVSDGS